ncbi:(d)CMP kinase [Tepidibacillus fermentans]|uniref:Cytidylate kinase n=1 Tax=Tepidibacillus fermentans TaxID=1281767 RepID=A0A4R3KK17_9BACI|nr:(d)CMP kinase [Tepidibacillus fermentans]TCS84123.1 cytidylate kinase [Tepidibacillus fermentans]
MKIAIDGPAGAGKSTVAKKVAHELGYVYIDTGAMYRALTYKAIQDQVDLHNGEALAALLAKYPVELLVENNQQKVKINHQDVTEYIRTPEISKYVSTVAAQEQVRKTMLMIQRSLAAKGNVIMDGRDIGTNVLPDADLKIFLTATIEERAKRRYQELLTKGYKGSFEEIKQEIASRDKQDQERKYAPLKQAGDAILIDTSKLTIDQVVNHILQLVKEYQEGDKNELI